MRQIISVCKLIALLLFVSIMLILCCKVNEEDSSLRTWFTVQNDTLRRSDSDLFVQLWMSEGQLNSLFDLLDLHERNMIRQQSVANVYLLHAWIKSYNRRTHINLI